MKKSLVLAMAMALGVTASAYAANPFSDVPAGHWAYDSVAKLAAAGVVDGYADGAFDGDKLMTRYEMAQIVAKAMAKGADCDKLAAEFADELDTLGVRVAKLEKKADNLKVTAQIRYSYRDTDGQDKDGKSSNTTHSRFRTRLMLNGAINEDWSYVGRFENNQYFTDTTGKNDGDSGDDSVTLNWAYVIGKVGGVKVEAGRQNFTNAGGSILDTRGDGLKVAYGKDVKLTGWVLKASDDVDGDMTKDGLDSDDRIYMAAVDTKLGVVDAGVAYWKVDANDALKNDSTATTAKDIWQLKAAMNIAKGLKLNAEYYVGDGDDVKAGYDDDGYLVGLTFGGAKAANVGSWGLYANYQDRPEATYIYTTNKSYTTVPEADGFKGYEIGANYTVAKNIVLGVKYYDLEARESKADNQTIWSEVIFTF